MSTSALERARAFVQARRLPRKAAIRTKDVDWQAVVEVAHTLRSEPTRINRYGFARLMTWREVAEFVQAEFPDLKFTKTHSLASAICARYHRAYPNRKCKIQPSKKSSSTSPAPSSASSLAPSPQPSAAGSRRSSSTSQRPSRR